MKTYSETMKSVLEKAAVITEEKQEKANKTRSRLKTIVGAALAFALVIGAVLVIKPFGERGNAGQFGYGADSEKSTPAVEETPSCGGDPDFTSEPSFITETAKVKRYDEGDTHNAELAMSMLTTDGYIYLDADGQHRNSYDASDPVLRNCTPDYVREHSTDIELFELASNTSVDYNSYFIRLGDTLYRYDPNHNGYGYYYNYMCLWDHDNNGVDDIVLFSTIFRGSCFMADVFDVSTKTVKQIVTRDMIRLPIFKFQFNGKNIYVNEKKLEYIGSEFYIGGVKADESILGATAVRRYEDGDKLNTERAMSMLKEDGYIDLNAGEVHRDYNNASDAVLRNCTPRHIRERSEDIELFQDESGAYFLRHLDKLYYSFGSSKICMCLWDYDKNGVDDLAFISNWGSGVVYLEASVFDLSAKSFRDIIYKNAPKDQPAFCFDFDGESIYIDGNKVEYIGGEFYIGGMKAKDYLKSLFDAENTPKPAEPIFITKKTEVIWNDDTYALNIDRFLTMLEADGYINVTDGVKHKEYDIENSDFCNLTPEYFRENFPEIEVFCDLEHRGRAYFLRFGDKLYCYEGITLNKMCLWDYDGNGVDDLALRLYKYSDEGIAYQWIECLDAITGELKPIFVRRADFTSSNFVFDYDGKNIYVDKLLLEYRDGEIYIGTRLAADHVPSFNWAEHELISSERINVKEYANGSSDNVELAYSILRNSGFIFEDGRRYTELDISGLSLRNCTSDYVIEKTDDIELFYNYHDWEAYFIRVGNELYRHDAGGGHHIYMLLWDYDKNGVEDVVMVSEAGSGTTYQEAVVFDVSTKEFKDIIHRNVYTDINFTFHFDGENIYIYLKKVEYKGGEFLIDGIIVQDYDPVPPTKEPEITPDGPNFIPAEEIKVKSYNDGDSINVELACSMLEEGGYISVIDGSVYTDYTADASRLRNCTPDFIREKRADIELFQTDDNAYFLRIADKLYRFDTPGGFHMKMCLWDYDKNGIDDLVFHHSWGSGNFVVEVSVLDVCMGTRMSILSRSAEVGHGFNLDYDAGRKMIYLYRNVVEYFDGEFYIGGMKVKDFCETQLLPQDTPEPTPSGSAQPDFITETTIVKNSYYYDFLNVDLVLSMIESNGYIDERTGERRFDYDRDSVYRNCTPECIRRKTADIDLVSDGGGDYFIRIKDELYCFRGSFIYMCLWDYDNNGIDDLVFCRSVTSGVYSFFANVFDLNTKEQKSIPLKEWYRESMQDAFGYDGESIYIDGFKVEYVDGAFYIGGVKADEYELAPEQNAQAHYLPAPTPFIGYAYNDILCVAPEDFSFTIKWGINGESSYSSKTGRLVKTTNATHPEDYVTELFLDEYTINRFYTNMLYHIDFFALFSQRDRYDPINDPSSESWIMTEPYETVMLSIEANGNGASVICDMIPLGEYYGYCYEAYTFYNLGVRFITDIIMNSPEWQALPEYEFIYE